MDLKKDPRLEYILIFKNHGSAAGASLSHPHSQLIAMPMVPIRSNRNTREPPIIMNTKNGAFYCDIMRYEMQQDVRHRDQEQRFRGDHAVCESFPLRDVGASSAAFV